MKHVCPFPLFCFFSRFFVWVVLLTPRLVGGFLRYFLTCYDGMGWCDISNAFVLGWEGEGEERRINVAGSRTGKMEKPFKETNMGKFKK